jgi:hypothetical protein
LTVLCILSLPGPSEGPGGLRLTGVHGTLAQWGRERAGRKPGGNKYPGEAGGCREKGLRVILGGGRCFPDKMRASNEGWPHISLVVAYLRRRKGPESWASD